MAQTIKIKRGLKANLPVLAAGEQAYCTDTKELFIGTANGNELLNGGASIEVTASTTLGATHANKFVLANHASTPIVLTIPTAATYDFANDTEIAICRYGEADVSVKTESGVVLNGQDSTKAFKISEQYNSVAVKKISDTAWVMSGAFDDPV